MPWQGQTDNIIDRFDGRAHLDYIPILPNIPTDENEEYSVDERQCNYESYRILAQNDFLGISEDKYLHQLYLEEQFGVNAQQIELEKHSKKKGGGSGAAIGYIYDDSTTINNDLFGASPSLSSSTTTLGLVPLNSTAINSVQSLSPTECDDSDSDIDVDVPIDITKLDTTQAHELNACGRFYGMQSNDFYSFLTRDADEADALRMAREEEQEKIMLSGRKSRRERRAQRERRFAGRPSSPPSYAAKEELPLKNDEEKNESESRSPTPENSGKVSFQLFYYIKYYQILLYNLFGLQIYFLYLFNSAY